MKNVKKSPFDSKMKLEKIDLIKCDVTRRLQFHLINLCWKNIRNYDVNRQIAVEVDSKVKMKVLDRLWIHMYK